eukprot:TRINITY_DN30282_c0_g1_i1.p1 TRINITY_DN30282_c0_g1~~TRINITY_DN30282_c0_g1_i1.p1  ORF type:complete len:539 (-),score=92.33 TRINITY_DN30282_c0_g1_i1:46-1662(-)
MATDDGEVGGGRGASHRGSFATSFAGYLQNQKRSVVSSGTGSCCGAVDGLPRSAPTLVPSQNHRSSVALSSAEVSAFLVPVRSRISVGRSRDVSETALPVPVAKAMPSTSRGAIAAGAAEMQAPPEQRACMDVNDMSPFEDNTLQRLSCAMRTLEAARAGSTNFDGRCQEGTLTQGPSSSYPPNVAGSTPCVGVDAAACNAIQQADLSDGAEPVVRKDPADDTGTTTMSGQGKRGVCGSQGAPGVGHLGDDVGTGSCSLVTSKLEADSPVGEKEIPVERSPVVSGSGVSGTTGPPSSITLTSFEELSAFSFTSPLPRLGSPPTMEGAVPVPPIAASDWLTKRLRTAHSSEPCSSTILASPQPPAPLPPQLVSEAAPFLTAAVKSRKDRHRVVVGGDCVSGGVSSSSGDSDPEYVERWTLGILKRSEQQRIKGHWASVSSSHAVASASMSTPSASEVEVASASALTTTSISSTSKPMPSVSSLFAASDASTLDAGRAPTTLVDGTSTQATAASGMEVATQAALEARTSSMNSASSEMHL